MNKKKINDIPNSVSTPISMDKDLGTKASIGVFTVFLARIITKIITFFGGMALARILMPEVFGIFAIVSFIVTIFSTFQDFGLGAALIQKKNQPTETDLKTVFTIQLVLVSILMLLILLTAPVFASFYGEIKAMRLLVTVLGISILITCFGVIPSILLERQLNYKKRVIPDIFQNVTFYGIAIGLSLLGYNVWCLVLAVLFSRSVGTVLLLILSPWKIGVGLDKIVARKLLSFGIPLQLNGLLSLINISLIPIYVGFICGAEDVGYLTMAMFTAYTPLEIVMVVGRVAFPAYSSIQDDSERLRAGVEKTIKYVGFLAVPMCFMMMALAPQLIHYVLTDKWMPALFAFYLYLASVIIGGIWGNIFGPVIMAKGKSRIIFTLAALHTVIFWSVGGILVPIVGYVGAAIAMLVTASIKIWIEYYIVNRFIKIKFWKNTFKTFLCSGAMAIMLLMIAHAFINSMFTLIAMGLIGTIAYLILMIIMGEKNMMMEMIDMLKNLKQK